MVQRSPESQADDVFDSFKALSMAEHGAEHNRGASKAELAKLNQRVLNASSDLFHSARVLQVALTADGDDIAQTSAALSSFQKRTKEVFSAAFSSTAALKAYLLNEILSPSMEHEDIRKLPRFFRDDLERIFDEVLRADKDDETALRRMLEDCYNQSTRISGSLHASRWFDAQEKTVRESLCEPDQEQTEPWDVRHSRCKLQRAMTEQRITTTWVRFWRDQVQNCQDGPTLFWPLDEHDGCGELPECPKYLFRTADDSSSGQNNIDFIASAASIFDPGLSKVDLLSPQTRSTAAQRLHNHLRKRCFDDQDITDNLSSWSSSLLFVVQYAIWRARISGRPLDQVMIYAVDTTQFPRGQFVSDKWLLKKLGDDVPTDPWKCSLMTLRAKGYDNGEYLSQGIVGIKNRSCAMSLGNLLFSGLCDLYPEFKDQDGSGKWTKRVQDLRSDWAASHKTTQDEISSAMQVAETCFNGFNCLDIAALLLTFKNRRLLDDDESSEAGAWTEYGPVEVRRYCKVMQEIRARGSINGLTRWGIIKALQGVLECEE